MDKTGGGAGISTKKAVDALYKAVAALYNALYNE